MKYYSETNVFDAALERIRFLFDEFETVIVGFSGGKDSTVTLNLALQVAEEKGRLPLRVMFLDQEAEWQNVIDYVQSVMEDPRVEPMWFQIPLRLFNSTSTTDNWLHCWEEGAEWMRPRWQRAFTDNHYGTDRFVELFHKIVEVDFPNDRVCYLAGVRCEESPTRFIALTGDATYKHITYGKRLHKKLEHYTFYPLYDWSYTDIWTAIHRNHWPYCRIYDYMYQQGVPIQKMRVSNVHHETSLSSLFYLQEIEGETWNRLTRRISGINTAGHLNEDNFFFNGDLPYMFQDWREYRDHLHENLLTDPEVKDRFRKKFDEWDKRYEGFPDQAEMFRQQINGILANDYHFTKMGNWERSPEVYGWKIWKTGRTLPGMQTNKYILKSDPALRGSVKYKGKIDLKTEE